jgi:diguanylate cyclase (GGDEF)-like protein
LAILVLDINRFKIINDSLGHPAGDAVLQEVGKRLAGHLGSREKISRIGGDDFHILLSDVKTVEEVASRAEKLIHILDEPVNAGGNRLFLSASLGAAIFPEDGNKAETLLKKADLAMHKAKEYGISSLRFYTEELSDMVSSRLTLENSLRRGLENKEFSLVYQPKFSLAKRRVEGFEALLRWKTPERLVSPWEFIPVAEEIGLILPLGEWVFLEVCRQIAAWRDEGFLPGEVAVNLSAKQLHHSDLLPMIRKALDEYSVDASLVGVEITESGLMENIAGSVEILSGLKELGMKVYVDDFGTGYSSLNYLKRLPIDVLKIDKSFIDGVYADRSDAAITRAIIGLGKALGMEIIAEGVESAEQLDFLLINGCDGIQGYLLSPPVSPSETLTFRKNEISRFFLNLLQRREYATERGAASE